MAKHFTNSRLLICEGNEECALVNELVKQGLIGTPDVIAIDAMSTGGGVTGIRRLLEVIQVDGTFSIVDSIGIVVDSDASQIDMFSYISGEILAANLNPDVKRKYAVPKAAYAKEPGAIALTVIFLPGLGQAGCLETLYWTILSRLHPVAAACVDALLACAGIDTGPNKWSQQKLDKARVRAIVSILNKSNPALAAARFWREKWSPFAVSEPELIPLIGQLNVV